MPVHKEYDGVMISCDHLGLTGVAWLRYAGWDDWYICMVKGTWANGNAVDGQLCRSSRAEVEGYLLRDGTGKLKKMGE